MKWVKYYISVSASKTPLWGFFGVFFLHCWRTCMFLVLCGNLYLNFTVRGIVCTCLITLCALSFFPEPCVYRSWLHAVMFSFFSSLVSCIYEPSICCHGIWWKAEDKRGSVKACHLPFHKLFLLYLFLLYFNDLIFIFLSFPSLFLCVYRHLRCHFFKGCDQTNCSK